MAVVSLSYVPTVVPIAFAVQSGTRLLISISDCSAFARNNDIQCSVGDAHHISPACPLVYVRCKLPNVVNQDAEPFVPDTSSNQLGFDSRVSPID